MVTSVNTRQFQEEFLTYVRGYQSILLGIALFLFSLYLYFHKHYWPASPDERAYLAWSFNIFKCGKYADIHGSPILGVPPLHCCLIAFSYAVYGSSLDSAQSVSIVFAALCSPLAFFMGRYLYNTLTGITAGILTATSFLLWVYSTRVLSETILTFSSTFSYSSFI